MAGIIKHAQAIKSLLSAVHGTSAYQETLEVQSRALASAIDNATFTLEEAAELAAELKGFPDAEKTMLTAKTTDRIAAPSQKLSRNVLQDFCFLPHYLTETTWMLLQSESEPTHVKLDALIQAAINLGMKCPSETTMQTICALHLLLEGKKKAMSLSPAMKLQMARSIKNKFRTMLARLQSCLPVTYVTRLPQSATIFKDSFPEWWQASFAQHPPIPSLIAAQELHAMMACIPMRGTRADSGSMEPLNSSSSSGSAAPDVMQVMMQFAKALGLQQSPPTLQIMETRKPEESRVLRRLQSRLQLEDAQPHCQDGEDENVPPTNAVAMRPAPEIKAPAEVQLQVLKPLGVLAATSEVMQAIAAKNTNQTAKGKETKEKATAKSKAKAKPQAKHKAEPKAKAKPQAKHKAEPKGKDKPQAKHKAEQLNPKRKAEDDSKKKNPTWSFEKTRDQILCRTGLTGPGQTKTIKGMGPTSVKKANQWVAEQKRG